MTSTEPRAAPNRTIVLRIEDAAALAPATAAEVAALIARVVRLVPEACIESVGPVQDDLALRRAHATERPALPSLLTEQEHRVASLAASGLSNKQIGTRLHLSPRTVSGHLYRVFPKLGIASRAQLGGALAGRGG